jgi:hypothetical protein
MEVMPEVVVVMEAVEKGEGTWEEEEKGENEK